MKRTLVLCVSFSLLGGAASASGQCTPVNPSPGDTVICSGNYFRTLPTLADDVTVLVEDGALLEIKTIIGGSRLGILNSGSISTGRRTIAADSGLAIRNQGEILSARDTAIQGEEDAEIINDGTITSGKTGIQVGDESFIENSGSILSLGSDGHGVDINSGAVENSGLIRTEAARGAGINVNPSFIGLEIINAVGAEIAGGIGILVDPENQAGQSVINSGTITGLSGTAIDLGAGEDFVMLEGGTVFGDILLGDDDDLFEMTGNGDSLMAALVDGGAGADTATFTDFNFADLVDTGVMGETVNLDFGAFGPVAFNSFELFNFADVQGLTRADFEQVAPVPLPAAGLLLVGAFGLMGAVGRRKV